MRRVSWSAAFRVRFIKASSARRYDSGVGVDRAGSSSGAAASMASCLRPSSALARSASALA
ncbi:hypothetical protein SBADM41S_11427 [Streptomyces badius]